LGTGITFSNAASAKYLMSDDGTFQIYDTVANKVSVP